MESIIERLKMEGISSDLIREAAEFSEAHSVDAKLRDRIPVPRFFYYGKKVWEEAIAALLCGKNILLTGEKATGKNVLAENLAAVFQHPTWDISFHINMDAASLIGTDTFRDGHVEFRPGPVYNCAENGGFGILDEINMARNEALAVLHSVLDYRRVIDVPGYERIQLADDTRFIATMNYNYAGTRELNEALASRFVVIQMPPAGHDDLQKIIRDKFPDMTSKYNHNFTMLFMDFQKKCESGELTARAMDLRGLLDAISIMRKGIQARDALELCITNKIFDTYEQGLIQDMIDARIPAKLELSEVFDR